MQVDVSIVNLAQALTWPLVALITLFSLRKHAIALAKGATNLNEALGKGGDVITLLERLSDVKKEAAEIKEMLETISIKDKGRELQTLASQAAASPDPVGARELTVDEMYENIATAWREVADIIRSKAAASNIKSNLVGTKGVSATVEALLTKGAVTNRAADLTKALSSQWQWIYRTSAPREEWLNQQVFDSFIDGANEARKSLSRIALY